MVAYSPCITPENMKQVYHWWNTQKNKAINTYVTSYAPKGKTYSKNNSLLSRVSIAGGIQILGCEQF